MLTSLVLILCDSLYYGELTVYKLWTLEDLEWTDWKVTPWHFVMYNFVPGNLAEHGAHPHYLHALINLQLLFGPLGNCLCFILYLCYHKLMFFSRLFQV